MAVQNARPSPFVQLTSDADWEAIFVSMGVGDGVVADPSTSLAPSLDTSGRNIVIAPGSALIKGKLWSCDASVSTPIPAASAQNRIDRLVLRLARTASTAATFVQPVLIQGTASGTPVEPTFSQTTTGNWDIPIAHWTSASSGSLTGLVDERVFTGKTMLSGLSTQRPTWLTRPTLMYETDTNNLVVWNGSSWVSVLPKADPWNDSPAMTNSWSKGSTGYFKYKKTNDNSVAVTLFNIAPGGGANNADGNNILAPGSIPGSYQPAHSHRIPVFASTQAISNDAGASSGNDETAAIVFLTDGSVQCFGISTVCQRIDLAWGEYPLDV